MSQERCNRSSLEDMPNRPEMFCAWEKGHVGYCFYVPRNVRMERVGDPGCTPALTFGGYTPTKEAEPLALKPEVS